MGGREIALSDVILKYTGRAVKSDPCSKLQAAVPVNMAAQKKRNNS